MLHQKQLCQDILGIIFQTSHPFLWELRFIHVLQYSEYRLHGTGNSDILEKFVDSIFMAEVAKLLLKGL